MAGDEASEPPSVNLSFANNFWGKEDAGVGPMLERMHNAKVTSDELKSFYAARAAIEDEYARKLLNLSRKPLGSCEAGTLKLSLNVIREQVESMGKAHQSNAQQMKTELEEPLVAFAGALKERRKIVQNGIEKLLKTKMQQTAVVNKTRDRYQQDCLKIKGFLAQAHMVMGQEERKNKARLEKTQTQLATTSAEYEAALKALEETTGRWNRDWKAACDKFQDLEEERIDFTKSSLWNFANIASTVCVSDDAACEQIRLSLEDCDVEKDITAFIQDNGTGQEIPDPPKFINYCRGDADTQSEASVDENYSVAQFPRSMNPAYRGAPSPQPSVLESHHDPNNPLAKELGHEPSSTPLQEPEPQPEQPPPSRQAPPQSMPPPQTMQPMQPVQSMPPPQPMQPRQEMPPRQQSAPQPRGIQPDRDPRGDPRGDPRYAQMQPPNRQPTHPMQPPQSSRGIQPDPRLIQAQQQARQSYQQSQVPHNDYPADGMTQFCRIGAPSERSAQPSPARPASRDSQSDYSNPTSFSSIEPPSGSNSPGKPMAPTPEPAVVEESPTKKKGGFFASPFARRRSKHENVLPQASITPTSRNTWAPSSKRPESASPTRPAPRYGDSNSGRGTILGNNARSSSPEPVDPRANFQLNVGNNVFDVASPDARNNKPKQQEPEELDPIAQALAELKGIPTKESTSRVSADRYAGLATPMPGTPAVGANLPGSMPTPLANMNASTPRAAPPAYENPAPMSRLGAPQPAHTSRAMRQTTERYVTQKDNMFNRSSSRPPTRGTPQEAPRAASPAPPRATSPRPSLYQPQNQPPPSEYRAASPNPRTASPAYAPSVAASRRAASPNPYAAPPSNAGRPRANTAASPIKPAVYGTPTGRGSYTSSRGASPGQPAPASARAVSPAPPQQQPPQPAYANTRPASRATGPPSRAVSPNPQFRQSYERPSSSRGSDMRSGATAADIRADMALQLAPGPGSERGDGSVYGGSQRGRGYSNARPMSSYGGAAAADPMSPRARSKSLAEPKMYTKEGRMILHYSRAMYMYNAQIPEELSFAKGDILAVLRLQDDGWWEAEVVGKNGRPGLVPSNYLQAC